MNRRDFVISSSAVSAALACAALPIRAVPAGRGSVRATCVLFDSRFGASRAFGAAAGKLHQAVFGFEGDVTQIWVEHLEPLWRSGTGMVAGMTTAPALMCLQQLAALHWFRVIGRVDHPAAEPGAAPDLVSWYIARRSQQLTGLAPSGIQT